ncbi:prepilin-type N-terminal cleavage/methylation domain-containing protein, partial [Liquorilactobacillus hordei]
MEKRKKNMSGFTLIEMSIVIFIIGILLLLIMP